MLLVLHSINRWLVLGALLARLGVAGAKWQVGREWTPRDARLGQATILVVDVQLLLGVALFALSPTVSAALSVGGAAMKDAAMRFWMVEHPSTMLLGVLAAHAGHALAKRAGLDATRHRAAAIGAGVALLCLLAAIPWPAGSPVNRALLPF